MYFDKITLKFIPRRPTDHKLALILAELLNSFVFPHAWTFPELGPIALMLFPS